MGETYEMLPHQKKIWNIEMAYSGTDICNIGGYLHLDGKYDTVLLQKTFDLFIRSQSSFWTKVNRQGKLYFEKIRAYHMDEYDLTGRTEAEADELIHKWICEPFAIYDSYLFDFRLMHFKNKTVIFEKFHHLIADGYAVSLCAKVQEKIYKQLEAGEPDFSIDKRAMQEVMKRHTEEKSEINKPEIKMSQTETDDTHFVSFGKKTVNPRAEVLSGFVSDGENNKNQMNWYIKKFDYQNLYSFCRGNRVSVEALFYGCLGMYLCKTRDGDGIAIGRNLLNRSRENMNLVALKVDTRIFEVRPEWERNAAGYLAEMKKNLSRQTAELLSAQEQADIEISYRPMRYLPAPGKGECKEYQNSSVEVPLKLFINDDGRSIELVVKYQQEAFKRQEVQKLIWKMFFIMDQILNNPKICLGGIELLEKSEKNRIEEFNSTFQWQYQCSLPERYLQMVREYPGKTALIYKGKTYSYDESYVMTNTIMHLIGDKEKDKESRIIGLCLKRSPWLPAAMFASWLCGYTFLPVSPRESEERKKNIADKCFLFITDDLIKQNQECKHPKKAEVVLDLNLPAYEMYTSGTTGEPKAVMISHRSLSCRLEWMEEVFGDGTNVILQKTRNTFDVSVWELILPFAFGKTMCVLEEQKESNPDAIVQELLRNCITMVHFVPSLFAKFLSYIKKKQVRLPDLKYIILSGEALGAELVKEAKRLLSQAEIYNLYGPTECTIDISYYRCTGDEECIPIGKPVYNTRLTVRNQQGEILPIGETGELVAQGDLVGMGYDGDANAGGYCVLDGKRAYRTGDLAVLEEDGELYYESRIDQQVKIRGMRVNPLQVEQSLNSSVPGTFNIVLCIGGHLIDFYQGRTVEEAMREKAAGVMPYYCIPSEFIRMEDIPTGKHGKADRKKLEYIYENRLRKEKVKQKFSEDWETRRREELLLKLAQELLGREDVTLDENFFDKGMDSLTLLHYLVECEQYGIEIEYASVYINPSIRALAKKQVHAIEPVVFLKREQQERLIILVPFAGGSPLSYWKLAKQLSGEQTDIAAINSPALKEKKVEEVVEEVLKAVSWQIYREIYLLGDCVGSALAIELTALLGERVKGLMICEALPYLGKRVLGRAFSIWDCIPDAALAVFLQQLRGKRFQMGWNQIQCFRNDVRRSVHYLRKRKRVETSCRVVLVFGDEDGITACYRKKYKQWRNWLAVPYKICTIPHGKHFLTEDQPDKLATLIHKELFRKEEEDGKGNV